MVSTSAGYFTAYYTTAVNLSLGPLTVSFTPSLAASSGSNVALLALTGTDNWYSAKDNTSDGFFAIYGTSSLGAAAVAITLKLGTTVSATQTISATSNKPIAWKCYKVGSTDGTATAPVDSTAGICSFTVTTPATGIIAAADYLYYSSA